MNDLDNRAIGSYGAVQRRHYTSAVTNAIESAAVAPSAGNAALETACGLVSRAFMAARVSGADADRFDPEILAAMGRDLIANGETGWLIARPLTWLPIFDVDANGLKYTTASGDTITTSRVLHARYSMSMSGHGISGLGRAENLRTLCARLEAQFTSEAAAAHGYLVPIPQSAGDDELANLRDGLSALKGKTTLWETVVAGWDRGSAVAPRREGQVRLGLDVPAGNLELYRFVYSSVLAVCGVPLSLGNPSATDSGQKMAFRHFLTSTVEPLARLIEAAGRRVGLDFQLDFAALRPDPLNERARAFVALVQGGLDVDEALGISALDITGDDDADA